MPAENDPADPNALTQSLQLTCSLTPSSTEPSTRWVIIWLKRCLPRSPIDPALASAPVTGGTIATGGAEHGPSHDGGGHGPSHSGGGVEHGPSQLLLVCAAAGDACTETSTNETATVSAADTIKLCASLAIVSARTTCRWDPRHRREASRLASHPH